MKWDHHKQICTMTQPMDLHRPHMLHGAHTNPGLSPAPQPQPPVLHAAHWPRGAHYACSMWGQHMPGPKAACRAGGANTGCMQHPAGLALCTELWCVWTVWCPIRTWPRVGLMYLMCRHCKWHRESVPIQLPKWLSNPEPVTKLIYKRIFWGANFI